MSTAGKIEILAPVGSAEMLPAAVYAGANAVYLGLQGFNARRSAGNFTASALAEAVAFCHARNVKVYVTMNTLLFAGELHAFAVAAKAVADAGADAAIVQDLGAAQILHSTVPQLALHASTQMSIHSVAGAQQAKAMGFTRAILARELSLAEIQAIHNAVDIELECFVHGALCMSISGQCYMSAFLGGRSGNRGACAGPCRLPFSAGEVGACHLSLKDMSVIQHLPAMQAAGVCSAKIEGRLRTPEYVAAAVNACAAARDGAAYDTRLLQDVFSRSGFTDGYLQGKIDGTMFGVRTAEDTAAAKAAAPRLRELFRRERPCMPVSIALTLAQSGAALTVSDGTYKIERTAQASLAPAQKDGTEGAVSALQKTGGTPFYAKNVEVSGANVWYLPAGEINALRRAALEELLAKRSTIQPYTYVPQSYTFTAHKPSGTPALMARFESVSQLPPNTAMLSAVLLPLQEWPAVPVALRGKTYLQLPRVLFGNAEENAKAQIAAASAAGGFAGFSAENLAHFALLKGQRIFGGFGLNAANPLAEDVYTRLGAQYLTCSVESTLADDAFMAQQSSVLLAYGHMPLMLTRACPLQNVQTCAKCTKQGLLTDRKNVQMPVRCAHGVRTVYNPVPLYMGDRMQEIPAHNALLYFTTETAQRAQAVLEMFIKKQPFDGAFTRGLYYKGTAD